MNVDYFTITSFPFPHLIFNKLSFECRNSNNNSINIFSITSNTDSSVFSKDVANSKYKTAILDLKNKIYILQNSCVRKDFIKLFIF